MNVVEKARLPHQLQQPGRIRPTSITIAAILFALSGLGEFLAGVVLLGFASLILLPVPKIGWLYAPFLDDILTAILVKSVAEIITAGLLWGCKKLGGVLAITLTVVGILVSIPVLPLAVLEVIIGTVLLIPVAVGWSSLT